MARKSTWRAELARLLPGRKLASTLSSPKRRNAFEPQVMAPHQVDLPLKKTPLEEIAVPASINGRSLAEGRP
ncbi:hypothetical protein [Ensifer soli]|uniref:hypothetical protein n=1 Tax=Ciceribacter sp. sgz301302 TaxID=3342379 RepID=UPI0035BB6C86